MALTKSYKEMILNDIKNDPEFAAELFKQSVVSIFSGELSYGLTSLRDIVNAGMGFQALSRVVGMTSQNLHRVLNENGNPTIKTLRKIVRAISDYNGYDAPLFAQAS